MSWQVLVELNAGYIGNTDQKNRFVVLTVLKKQVKALMLLMLRPWCDLICFTLELCNFTLNIFKDFLFASFELERQCLCKYRLLKTYFLGKTKLKSLNVRYFLLQIYRHCMFFKKVLPKHSMVIFGLVYRLEEFKRSIVVHISLFLFK